MKISRRLFLQYSGISLALPLLETVLPLSNSAYAATNRQRFIGVYYPNGAYMPGAINGDWTWDGALQPLVAGGFKQNTMLFRGLHNGFTGIDPHWQNTAGMLSCHPIQLGNPSAPSCGKSLEQYIGALQGASYRSLQVGGLYNYAQPGVAHEPYSMDYLNRIAWKESDRPLSPLSDPKELFLQIFSSNEKAKEKINYDLARRRSILDLGHKDADRLAKRMPAEYQRVMESYQESIRSLENRLVNSKSCNISMGSPAGDFSDPNKRYRERFELVQEMIVLAFQCGLTNVATIMYSPSIGSQMTYQHEGLSGAVIEHHSCAHHGGDPVKIARLKQINRLHVGLLGDLLGRIKSKGLLDSTLVFYGTDMSDGNTHNTANLPVLLCGGGKGLKWGEEIGSRNSPRPLSDLHLEILKLTGVTGVTSFGSGQMLSTGQNLGIRI